MACQNFLSQCEIADMRGTLSGSMGYTAQVSRPTSPGRDDYGQPLPPSWALLYPGLVCTYIANKKMEQDDKDRSIKQGLYRILVPYGSDIKTTDRIDKIWDLSGTLVESDVVSYRIREVIPRQTHLALTLEAIRIQVGISEEMQGEV